MSRAEYIAALTSALRGRLAAREIDDIVRDYMEFFDDGVSQGKSEEQVAEELGNPREVARQILSDEPQTEGSQQRKAAGLDFDGIRNGFAKGASKVADEAGKFAASANAFTKRKMQGRREKASKMSRGTRDDRVAAGRAGARTENGGCLMLILKLLAFCIIAPALALAIIGLVLGFLVGGAGILLSICGFVVVALAAPVVPLVTVICGVLGMSFAICLTITVMLLMLYLGQKICIFIANLFLGRSSSRQGHVYEDGWRVSGGDPAFYRDGYNGAAYEQGTSQAAAEESEWGASDTKASEEPVWDSYDTAEHPQEDARGGDHDA